MKRLILILIPLFFLSPFTLMAQDVLDGVYVKEHVPARKPVPYHHLREADMMWSKKIWRILDLREKINHPLYYPITTADDRYSLTNLMLYGIEQDGLVVYDAGDDEFTVPMTITQIDEKLGVRTDTAYIENLETGELETKAVKTDRNPAEIKSLMLKEVWYFDKQRSMLEVRIVGFCPIRMYVRAAALGENTDAGGTEGEEKELDMKPVFWVYFNSARPLMARHEVFNPFNDSERRTFDDIFFKRRFSSYIYKETNVYDNRYIGEFRQGLDALLESERIKDFMFKVEHDLWEF